MTKEQYIKKLQTGVAIITFEKRDGTLRSARATLKPEIVAPHLNGSGRQSSDLIVPFIDLDINQFRSFRIDSVKTFRLLESNES